LLKHVSMVCIDDAHEFKNIINSILMHNYLLKIRSIYSKY
jgi:hypothetical protein